MEKLQEMIDGVFDKQAELAPRRPRAASLERERALGEPATKIKALRAARLRSGRSQRHPPGMLFDSCREGSRSEEA
jgi:hypothetical protein